MPQTLYEKIKSTIGKQLKRFRKSRKLTEADMAKVLRIDESRWRKFEAGDAEIALTQVTKLASRFEIEEKQLRDFLCGRDPKAAIPA